MSRSFCSMLSEFKEINLPVFPLKKIRKTVSEKREVIWLNSRKFRPKFGERSWNSTNHVIPLASFYTLWKYQKTSVFVIFKWDIERNQWHNKGWSTLCHSSNLHCFSLIILLSQLKSVRKYQNEGVNFLKKNLFTGVTFFQTYTF